MDSKVDLFNGIFSFQGFNIENILSRRSLINHIKEGFMGIYDNSGTVNYISFNSDVFSRRMNDEVLTTFKLRKLSFSYFISNLLLKLSKKYFFNEDDIWYPLTEGKTEYKEFSISRNTDGTPYLEFDKTRD